jgi:hypothetical protein
LGTCRWRRALDDSTARGYPRRTRPRKAGKTPRTRLAEGAAVNFRAPRNIRDGPSLRRYFKIQSVVHKWLHRPWRHAPLHSVGTLSQPFLPPPQHGSIDAVAACSVHLTGDHSRSAKAGPSITATSIGSHADSMGSGLES